MFTAEHPKHACFGCSAGTVVRGKEGGCWREEGRRGRRVFDLFGGCVFEAKSVKSNEKEI